MADPSSRRLGGPTGPGGLAFDALRAVNANGALRESGPGRAARPSADLTGRDAGFATELVAGTCRWQGSYDLIIAAASGRELKTLQPAVLDLLRLGTHQLLAMRVPAHAAVAAMVDLAAATVGRRVTGLVNAVLRRIAARRPGRLAGPASRPGSTATTSSPSGPPTRAGSSTRTPTVLPADELEAGAGGQQPARPRSAWPSGPGWPRSTSCSTPGAEPGRWSPYAARWSGNSRRLCPRSASGRAGVQDEGSQLVACRPGPAPTHRPDRGSICAPGRAARPPCWPAWPRADGDTAAGRRAGPAPGRAGRAGRSAAYPTADRPAVIVADGTAPAWRPSSFSRVLADVPCTGLGALRRRPESRWRREPRDVEQLHPLQARCCGRRSTAAAPGGRGRVRHLLAASPGDRRGGRRRCWPSRDDSRCSTPATLLPELPDATIGPYLQLWPHRHGTDAMFAAYLRRASG